MTIMTKTESRLAIGDVALAAGVKPSAIRFYERKGLLPAPQRSGGQRRYSANILQLLRVIEVSKAAGFTLKEIEDLLHGFERRTPPSKRWRARTEEKLRELDTLIARADGMRALLKRGLECGCLTLEDCSLIE
jgi:MerR family transcriptional regulator, redox-sensitive transcriptional activator SoxR